MMNKEKILRLIDEEMTSLIALYENRIKQLEEQVEAGKRKITALELENDRLKKQVEEFYVSLPDQQLVLLDHIKKLNGGIPYALIDEWCLSSSFEDAFLLFVACEELWINKDLEKLNYIIELIVHNQQVLQHDNEEVTKIFLNFVEKIILDEMKLNEESEKLIFNLVTIFNSVHKVPLKEIFEKFVRDYHGEFFGKILLINEPSVIFNYLRMLMVFGLEKEVKSALTQILNVEWKFIDGSLNPDEFTILLWYCYLFDFDDYLIELASKSIEWFNENIDEQNLYFYSYEDREFDNKEYQEKVNKFLESTLFTEFEKKRILQRVDSKVILNSQKSPQIGENINSIHSEDSTDQTAFHIEAPPANQPEKLTMANAFERLENLLLKEKYEKCSTVADEFFRQINPDTISLESLRSLSSFLTKVFTIVPNGKNQQSLNELFYVCITILQIFSKKETIEQFITKNEKIVHKRLLESRDLKLIIKLAESYFKGNYDSELAVFINRILDNWNPGFANMEYRYLVELLWYCFYTEKEDKLLKAAGEGFILEKYKGTPDVDMVNLYLNIKNGKIDMNSGRSEISTLKKKGSLFTKKEREKLYICLDKRLMGLTKSNKSKDQPVLSAENKTLRKIAFVTKLPGDQPKLASSQSPLQKELVQLAVYKDPFLEEQKGYIFIEVFVDKNGKSYILEEDIKVLKKKIGSKWPDIRAYSEDSATAHKNPVNLHSPSFAWPSTEIKGTSHIEEKNLLNEESQLKKLGYQITGLTRNKRWQILEVAVKQLGLKKVAYTIAQNVKLRKGQKNGVNKFSYSIGEWEYDLNKLKQKYYKNDFTWPTTKINH